MTLDLGVNDLSPQSVYKRGQPFETDFQSPLATV